MENKWKTFGVIALLFIAGCATPPGTKRISAYGVLVPEDTSISPAPPNTPQGIKDLLGVWGNGCWQGKDEGYSVVLIIKSVTAEDAIGIYSFGGAESRNWKAPPPIPYKQGETKILNENGKYLIRLGDDKVKIEFWREGEFMAGRLVRQNQEYTTRLTRLE
ncbi:MAG: hypothetical protein PHS17_04730 [Desulfobacterales bacterium]|nr:hypothetical protein [Desulfobacterales bacterium]